MYSIADFYRHARLMHVYVSTFVFSLLILFSLTGLFLNHPGWFETSPQMESVQGQVDAAQAHLLQAAAGIDSQPDLAGLAEYFRQRYGLGEPEYMAWDRNFNEASLDFSAPGGYAQIVLDTVTGGFQIQSQSSGAIEILNDLHKGRHAGGLWRWVIDLTAMLVLVFALTGLALLVNSLRFRTTALVLLAAGTLSPLLIYWLGVPSL